MATPPTFIAVDPLQDLEDLISAYETIIGETLPPAAAERLILNAMAYRISLAKQQIQDAATQNLVDFSQAPALDYLGNYVGVTRLAASPATCTINLTLSGSPSPITIPQGTRFGSSDGLVVFALTADINVLALATSATGECECTVDGTVGNDYGVGTITNILDPQPYLTAATNPAATTGGAETETDDALRERILLAPAAFGTAGSRKAYQYWARTASSLIVDVAVPDSPGNGIVNVFPLMADGSVTPAPILTAVSAALTAETVRPLSDTPVVASPTRVNYTLNVEITVYTGASYAGVTTAVEDALNAWAESKRQTLGQDIVDTQIHAAIHAAAPGEIYDITLVGWTDIVIAETEFGYLNLLTVTVTGDTIG